MDSKVTLHKCTKCNKEHPRIFDSYKGRNRKKFLDDKGRTWRSPNQCPDCALEYSRKHYNYRPIGILKQCIECSKDFITKTGKQQYCSIDCRYDKIPDIRNCTVCNTEYKPKAIKQTYCSKVCRVVANRPNQDKYNKNKVYEYPKSAECSICKEVYIQKRKVHTCCSKKCAHENRKQSGKLIEYRKHNRSQKKSKPKTEATKAAHKRYKKSREMAKIQRMPKWVDKQAINKIYELCPKDCYVDHIIPLKGEQVSGLHVPWNFQYLDHMSNSIKSNQFDGTYENNSWRTK